MTNLRKLLDGLMEAVCRFAPDGTLLYVNPAYCEMTGHSAAELVGKVYAPVVFDEDLPHVELQLASMTAANPVVVIENRVRLPTGEVRWVQWTNRGFFDADGTLLECQSAGRDVTTRVEAEGALRTSNERFRFLAEASEVLASELDYEKTLAAVTRLAVPFLADQCSVTMIARDVLHPVAMAHVDPDMERRLRRTDRPAEQLTPALRALVARLMEGQSVLVPDFTPADLDRFELEGEDLEIARLQRACSYMIVPLEARGRTLGALAFVSSSRYSGRRFGEDDLALAIELSRRAAQAVDNARLYAELQEADRRKDEFLAILSHELRNPLAAIATALDLLEQGERDPALRERALGIARRQAQHQARLIEDLLDVSRLMRGRIELRYEQVDLAAALRALVDGHLASCTTRGQTVTITVPTDRVTARVDPTRFDQIVGNLLENACKYSPDGSSIDVGLEHEVGVARIRVRDTGVGLAAESLPKVFEPFVQVGDAHARPQSGLGLGLSVVRHLVELHGGTVSVASPGLGLGAEFTVELPLEDAAPVAPPRSEPAPRQHPLRVLVIDDNEDAADMLSHLLELWGHQVHVAYSGQAAVEAARGFQPEVSFVDIGMPGMDGYETALALRELPGLGSITLIALTGYAQHSDIEKATGAGFDHHVAKPVRAPELRDLLATFQSSALD